MREVCAKRASFRSNAIVDKANSGKLPNNVRKIPHSTSWCVFCNLINMSPHDIWINIEVGINDNEVIKNSAVVLGILK